MATTQVSLVRLHTEKIRPPRALWVPFEFGRPLGVPGDAAFQRRVLLAVLALLEAPHGPVLADFPDDAPGAEDVEGWACPVNFARPEADPSEAGALRAELEREIAQLRPWYDLAVERGGRTTVGASGLEIEAAARFVAAFLDRPPDAGPRPELSLGDTLRLACDDLKAFCIEAVAAQPGQASSTQLLRWFWHQTATGRLFAALRPRLLESEDEDLRHLAGSLAPPE